jgi:hypothetical protein
MNWAGLLETRLRDEEHKRQRALINQMTDWAEKYAGRDAEIVQQGRYAVLTAGDLMHTYIVSVLMEAANVSEALHFLRQHHRHSSFRIHRRLIVIYFGRFAQYAKAVKRLKEAA